MNHSSPLNPHDTISFQDQGSVRGCYGCGADNKNGLQIKSFWDGEDAIATYLPKDFQNAGRPEIVYGGLIASLLDCHSINLAIANHYKEEKREIGSSPKIYCVTAQLNISYLLPTPMGETLELRARIEKRDGRKTWISTTLSASGQIRAKADVLGIRIVN
jgi:acyl-coenzyme A thioesterase PaaI-like protein